MLKILMQTSFLLLLISSSLQAVEDKPVKSASATIERLIGNRIKKCHLILQKDSQGKDFYEYSAKDGILTVKANSAVSLCRGAYDYLREVGSVQAAWQDHVVKLPKSFPDRKTTRMESPCEIRLFLNVCQFGYTSPWWQWKDWERMIDWMAFHGYNSMPAMLGQEIIWYELFTEMGVAEEEMDQYFAGGAYLPWQRMGNVAGISGPLPKSYLLKQKAIQKKIVKRMHSLGMTVVAPGFSGFVPQGLQKVFPKIKLSKKGWKHENKFVYLLDLQEDLFKEIGTDFVKRYRETYGNVHYFLCDTFNENKVHVSKEAKKRHQQLADYGNNIYQSLKEADPKAVWVTQAWMFIADAHFWNADNAQALFSKVPDKNMLIIDFGNDRKIIWKTQRAYNGKPWLHGYIHNYGGVTPLQGDLALFASAPAKLRQNKERKNLSGYALCPEGSHTNYVIYAMASDAAWKSEAINVENWLKNYSENRYGMESKNLNEAWRILERNIYNTKYWSPRIGRQGWGSFFYCKPPSSNTNYKLIGKPEMLIPALNQFFKERKILKNHPLYRRDALDFTRHYIESIIDEHIKKALTLLKGKDIEAQDKAIADVKTIMTELDELLAASPQHSLSEWLIAASSFANSDKEAKIHMKTARQIVTIWGGNLNGYASKGWHGMIKGFYLQRWLLFFENLQNKTAKKHNISDFEKKWINRTSIPKIKKNNDVVRDCYHLFKKYSVKHQTKN